MIFILFNGLQFPWFDRRNSEVHRMRWIIWPELYFTSFVLWYGTPHFLVPCPAPFSNVQVMRNGFKFRMYNLLFQRIVFSSFCEINYSRSVLWLHLSILNFYFQASSLLSLRLLHLDHNLLPMIYVLRLWGYLRFGGFYHHIIVWGRRHYRRISDRRCGRFYLVYQRM